MPVFVPAALPHATHWGHALPPGAAASSSYCPSTLTSCAPRAAATWNASWCAPVPNATIVGEFGLSLTLNTTPANGSGPAPLNFSWALKVYSGGLPPYRAWLEIMGSVWDFNSTSFNGTVTLARPGTYDLNLLVEDSSCTQVSGLSFPIMALGRCLQSRAG